MLPTSPSDRPLNRRDFVRGCVGALAATGAARLLAAPDGGPRVPQLTPPPATNEVMLPAGASIVAGPTELRLPVGLTSVFTGCYNQWGRTSYWRAGAWEVNIESVRSASTCGSPIFASADWWAGFLREGAGRVSSDGHRVTLEVPAGQELLLCNPAPHDESAWYTYVALAEARLAERPQPGPAAPHWTKWEYCTWVEQKALTRPGLAGRATLNEALVRSLAARVRQLRLPPGKFTIDDGWQQTGAKGDWTDGAWRVDERKFPDLARLCGWLKSEGFTPGLWFGLPLLPADAPLRRERPELFGAIDAMNEAETDANKASWSLAPTPATEAYLRETLRPYAQMGFRKFKFDFFYGARSRMNALIRTVHRAVRSLDPTIEIESHHPDFFFSRWTDSCRLNDVLVQPGTDWEGLTLAHMRVTRLCAPDRIMNLDHLGGNDPAVSEHDFLRHLDLLALAPADQRRYAVLSLLPDRFSAAARERVRAFVQQAGGA